MLFRSRPLDVEDARSVSFAGSVIPDPDVGGSPFDVSFQVEQGGADASARGSFEALGADGARGLTLVRLGLLQTRGAWAAFSLRLADENGVERGGYVVIDGEDPMSDDEGVTLVIVVEGRDPMVGRATGVLSVQ